MGSVVDPLARRGNPLGGDAGGVPDGSHQFTMTARLDADDAEAVLGVVVRDALDEAGQNFLGRCVRLRLQRTPHEGPHVIIR